MTTSRPANAPGYVHLVLHMFYVYQVWPSLATQKYAIFARICAGEKTYETGPVCKTFGPKTVFPDCYVRLGRRNGVSHVIALIL